VLGEHGVNQQSGARIFMSPGIHGLLFSERMRDQLGVTPPDQGAGCGAGSGQIISRGGFDKRLHVDSEGAGQVCVMILDGFDRLRVCGACCDNDRAHENSCDSTR
jgi:hypothetical protein